jgi:hypothetical protein
LSDDGGGTYAGGSTFRAAFRFIGKQYPEHLTQAQHQPVIRVKANNHPLT